MTRLDQYLPRLAPGDATSEHATHIRRFLHEAGIESDIYVESADPSMQHLCRDHHEHQSLGAHPVLYQLAIGSVLADKLAAAGRLRLGVNYHNFTPESFFAPWEPDRVHGLRWGLHQRAVLAGHTELAMAVSRYNAADLTADGYPTPVVVPVLVDVEGRVGGVDSGVVDRVRGGAGSVWLFVGRLAPNKAQHDVVRAFAVFRELVDRSARLVLVGGSSSDRYVGALELLVSELGLGDSVVLAGSVPDEELGSYYAAADVFVCMSEHEGFCVPVLEAMFHDTPVVAFAAAAVPETVGSAGLVVGDKSPVVVAQAVQRLSQDQGLREGLVAAGRARVEHFSLQRGRTKLLDALTPLIESRQVK